MINPRWKYWMAATVAGWMVALAAGTARAQVQREIVASAGSTVESGGQVMSLTLGEPAAGRATSGTVDLASGFLAGSDESAPAECCVLRGDLDHSGRRTPADIVLMINSVLKGAPAHGCPGEADLNGNGEVSISDIVLLIGDVFRGVSLPLACGEVPTVAPRITGGGDLVRVEPGNEHTRLVIIPARHVAAVQLELTGQGQDQVSMLGDLEWQVESGRHGDCLILGALDMAGAITLVPGDSLVLEIDGDYKVVRALLSTPDGIDLVPKVEVLAKNSVTPDAWELEQCVPNPFNPDTRIAFSLPEETLVRLDVFNVLGQNVATPLQGTLAAGRHTVVWNAGRLPSGVYFYRLQSGSQTLTKQMMLLK